MSDDSSRPIVIKRIKKMAGGHHGGAWKLAYADFVTAMMAFFLLMWLLGSTATGDLQGIAEYFQNPLKVSMQGGSGSGDATSVIQGGGLDLARQNGQVRKSDDSAKKSPSSKSLNDEAKQRERVMLNELKKRIELAIESNPAIQQFKNQLLLDITSEGLRIQIVDEKNRPMFDLAGDQLKPYTREILKEIGKVLNAVPNRITLSGHTDAAQFAAGARGFSNWELSANRANSSRRELVVGGMDEHKVLRVVGMSSTVLFDRNDPLNPVNRRISIVVLNKETEESFLRDVAPDVEVSNEAMPPSEALTPGAAAPAGRPGR
ncbi:MAG TPA: flagellar motor protein MotB [Azospira sp.]|nr:flagellar motor protein MotB [Azospira sp.]